VIQYPYQAISNDPSIPPAPILRVSLFNPDRDRNRLYELDAFLDTGADGSLIPLEVVSVLRLSFLEGKVPVRGIGGAITKGFLCQAGMYLGEIQLPLIEVVAFDPPRSKETGILFFTGVQP
jgi:hypothetical protein